MSMYRTALSVEWTKFRRSVVSVVTSALLVLGIVAVVAASLTSIGGEGVLAAKAEALAGRPGWPALFSLAGQVTSVGGLLGFGVMVGWLHGREFTEGTVAALFARPVSLAHIAAAKLTVYLAWAIAVAAVLTLGVLALGGVLTLAGGPGFGQGTAGALPVKLFSITLLTALLALPCALVATLTRGYLAAIAAAIMIVVLSQIAVMLGAGGWFPFAAPGLWAVGGGRVSAVTVVQLALVPPLALVAAALTLRSWRRLTL